MYMATLDELAEAHELIARLAAERDELAMKLLRAREVADEMAARLREVRLQENEAAR